MNCRYVHAKVSIGVNEDSGWADAAADLGSPSPRMDRHRPDILGIVDNGDGSDFNNFDVFIHSSQHAHHQRTLPFEGAFDSDQPSIIASSKPFITRAKQSHQNHQVDSVFSPNNAAALPYLPSLLSAPLALCQSDLSYRPRQLESKSNKSRPLKRDGSGPIL